MKQSNTTTEKINIWMLELKISACIVRKTAQQEQGWDLPEPESWIQKKEYRTGHSATGKGAGK